eukprot:TRINITY_DN14013_c0_g4_i1.p1 TRINITY_DN14013_c0_g4~~TRINITY_DN14013_c0_g4_i1.p1  ORF type:complete len:458 (+),score=147.43 TRINITY_DN14013_c0_g4_i1:86-1459(+)
MAAMESSSPGGLGGVGNSRSAANSAAHNVRTGDVVTTTCMRCSCDLRIVDDLPPSADFAHSFRGGLAESFVVVPDTNDQCEDFSERRPGEAGAASEVEEEPAASQQQQRRKSQQNPRVPSHDEIQRVEKIIEMASGQTEADHPVCGTCLQLVINEVQRQVEQAADEHRTYQAAHERLQQQLGAFQAEETDEDIEREIQQLEAEALALEEEMAKCDALEAQLKEEEERQQTQETQLEKDLEELWLGVAAYQVDLEDTESERAATASAIHYATAELNRLKRTNVLNDMFHISHEGPFGTINRLRLGKMPPDQPVPWEEINAALGQACLLLDALLKKVGLQTQYRLRPRGSYSAIEAGAQVLELHSSDGSLTRFFADRNFDLAMSTFLACLREVTKHLQRDNSLKMKKTPFVIEDDKVSGFSVKMQFNKDERWTKALKFMLSHLKWIIALVESRELPNRS